MYVMRQWRGFVYPTWPLTSEATASPHHFTIWLIKCYYHAAVHYRRWQIFFVNRRPAFRESTDQLQWKYLPSNMNPADDATRGLPAQIIVAPTDGFMVQHFIGRMKITGHCNLRLLLRRIQMMSYAILLGSVLMTTGDTRDKNDFCIHGICHVTSTC